MIFDYVNCIIAKNSSRYVTAKSISQCQTSCAGDLQRKLLGHSWVMNDFRSAQRAAHF